MTSQEPTESADGLAGDATDGSSPKYRVTHTPLGSARHDAAPSQGAQPPRYDRERDEPAFVRAWRRVDERMSRTPSRPMPPPPPVRFRLRGGRNRRLVDAPQSDSGPQDA